MRVELLLTDSRGQIETGNRSCKLCLSRVCRLISCEIGATGGAIEYGEAPVRAVDMCCAVNDIASIVTPLTTMLVTFSQRSIDMGSLL